MRSNALVPKLIAITPDRILGEFWISFCGMLLMICLAQVAIPLPYSPVPFTGQTFGCFLIALSWGGKRAPIVMALYLFLGALGAPVFAGGASGLMGPTFGYLFGMLLASGIMGILADRGWAKNLKTSVMAGLIGMTVIYLSGLLVLSLYVPTENLLAAGFWPFLPGDLVKCVFACYITYRAGHLADPSK